MMAAPRLAPRPALPAAFDHVQPRHPGALELAAQASHGQRAAQLALLGAIGVGMERTLYRVLGNDAPIAPLLEAALLRALNSAAEYRGDEPLALWADRSVVQVVLTYLGGRRSPEPIVASPVDDRGSVRVLLARVQLRLRQVRPEEHVAFALLDLDGRALLDTARLLSAAPVVVRQRAGRARRHLLFAARSDRTIATYLRLSDRLRALAARLQRERPAQRPSVAARLLHESIVGALHGARH